MRNQPLLVYGLVIAVGTMSGCASFGRGVTEAVLDRQTEDTRQCWINGREFDGLDRLFESVMVSSNSDGTSKLKILKVHGIGSHTPGLFAASAKWTDRGIQHRRHG